MIAASFTNVQTFVGLGGSFNAGSVVAGPVGFSGSAGEIDLGIDVVSSTTKHVGLEVHGLSASVSGAPITLAVQNLDAQVDSDGFDWATLSAPGLPAFTMTGATTLGASGSAAASADGFVNLAGSFNLTKTTSLLTLTLTNPTVFVGIGGSVDTTRSPSPTAVGFHGSASSVKVALDTSNHYGSRCTASPPRWSA